MRTIAILLFVQALAACVADDETTLQPGAGKADGTVLADVRLTPRNPKQTFKVLSDEYISSDLEVQLGPYYPTTKVTVTTRHDGVHAEWVLTNVACLKNGQPSHDARLVAADAIAVPDSTACNALPPAHLKSSSAIETFDIAVEKTSFDVDEVNYSIVVNWY